MDPQEIKLDDSIVNSTNMSDSSFFGASEESNKQRNSNDLEQASSSPSQKNVVDKTLRTSQLTRDQQLNINSHNTHKPKQLQQQALQQSSPKTCEASSSSHHKDNRLKASMQSLQLKKRIAKHCSPENMKMERQSSSSKSISISTSNNDAGKDPSKNHQRNKTNMSKNHKMHKIKMTPLNFSSDREQESKLKPTSKSLVPKARARARQRQSSLTNSESTDSNTTSASIVSVPGAYMMNGANVIGRAQIGMITPFERKQQEQEQEKKKCDENQLLTSNMDSDDEFDSHSHHGEEITIKRQQIPASEQHQSGRWRRRMWCIGIAVVVLIVAVITAVFISKRTKSMREISYQNDSDTNSISSKQSNNDRDEDIPVKARWSDLSTECSIHGTINQTLIDPTLISNFHAVKQHYTTNDNQEEVVIETCGPQHLALWSIALSVVQRDNTNPNNDESDLLPSFIPLLSDTRYVLSVFFFSLGGPQWNKHFNWLSSENECDWFGVSCLPEGKDVEDSEDDQRVRKVVSIDLRLNNLDGTIPIEFYRLTSTQSLDLEGNDIRGTISTEIENLSNLTNLNLFETSLSAPLPSELFSLPSLLTMFLSDTTPPSPIPLRYFGMSSKLSRLVTTASLLGGSIPTEIGLLTSLNHLGVRGSLRGRIPQELGNLSLMERIIIGPGSLSGSLPDQLFESNKNWKRITIGGNKLTGPIPTLIGSLKELKYLRLSENGLSGSIPSEIGRCSRLKNLDLKFNRLRGTIPTEIGMMNSLKELDLKRNKFTGTVPTEISRLQNLQSMRLSACQGLSGTIPSLYCEKPIMVEVDRTFCIAIDSLRTSCRSLSCCKS